MKVEIKITNDALMAVNSLLQGLYDMPVSVNPLQNVYASIGYDLADMFDSKLKSKIKKADLFDHKKPVKFTFKFHEAWALIRILIDLKPYSDSAFKQQQIQTVIDKLDAKLC